MGLRVTDVREIARVHAENSGLLAGESGFSRKRETKRLENENDKSEK